jgi:porin
MNVGQYGTSGVAFGQTLGISAKVSDSTSNVDLFRTIAWRQQLADGLIDLRVGQVEPTSLFNSMPYANDNRAFLASPLSNEASRTLPAAGVGATLNAEILENVFLGGAIADANGKGEFLNFDSFFQGDYLSSAYLAVEPEVGRLGKGRYQVAMHFVDATSTAAYSRFLGVNLEQAVGPAWAVFAKYNRADGRQSAIGQSAAAGVVWKEAFGFQEDWLGTGIAWAEPSNSSLRDEYVIETFWRNQLTPLIQVTPSIQFWVNPSQTPDEDFQAVFTIRALAEF